ncbi:MAG: FdtA/QdtA family cupin domain-containing protein [Candidatus Blackburnbacteria bacterium]|nr:FdtA/QdtA family cupin domain-containing protein [Candidatus Blackburnbacteria bacterium]
MVTKKPKIGKKKIRVRNSGIVNLQYFEDPPDGNLAIGEVLRNIPFKIKRFYFINSLENPKALRGKHAHKKLEQIIFCINGSFTLHLDDGETKQRIKMDNPYIGIRLGPLLWNEMGDFSQNCVILIIANDYFRESDYIRDYSEFLDLVK